MIVYPLVPRRAPQAPQPVELAKKKTKPRGLQLSPIEACEMVRADPEGDLFVGMPTVAHANIP